MGVLLLQRAGNRAAVEEPSFFTACLFLPDPLVAPRRFWLSSRCPQDEWATGIPVLSPPCSQPDLSQQGHPDLGSSPSPFDPFCESKRRIPEENIKDHLLGGLRYRRSVAGN